MPQVITINVLGFEPTKSVPATVEEYNALAPARNNPVLEDAIDTTIYRGTSPVIRAKLCDLLEAPTEKGGFAIARKNAGTEEDPQWEKEGTFVKRAIAELMQRNTQTEAQVRATIAPFVQKFSDEASFPVATKARNTDGPAVGKNDLNLAAQVIKDGKADAVATALSLKLARTVTTDEKDLARAIADDRRARAAAAAAAQKAELGI